MASLQKANFDLRTIYNELSVVKYKWFRIGILLGVPRHKLKEFEKDEQDPLAALIDYWLKGNIEGVPLTWKWLVTALKSSESALARRIRKKYCQDEAKSEENESSSIQDSVTGPSTITSSGSSSFQLPAITSSYFPYLRGNRDSRMSDDDLSSLCVELDAHTLKIKRTFASLVFDLQKYIKVSSSIDDLVSVLKFLDFSKFEGVLKDCSGITEVFDRLSPYFSFFDFEIIKLLTKKLGSDDNKLKLEKYKKMFKDYSKQRVCECPSDALDDTKKSEKVLVMKADKSLRTLTVEETWKLKYEVCKVLGVNLRLLRIENGCVKFTFRSLDFDGTVVTVKQQQALKELQIQSIKYGKEILNLSSSSLNKIFGTEHMSDSGFYTKEADSCSQTTKRSVAMNKDLYDSRIDMIVSAESKPKALPVLSPLYLAILDGNLTLAKSLIANGKNPMEEDMNDNSCLHYAVGCGQFEILKYLIEEVGCPAGTTGWHGSTLLHIAAQLKHFSLVQYLVESEMCRLDPTTLDENGHSAMHHACRGGNLDIVAYLMDCMTREYMKLEDILYEDPSTLDEPSERWSTEDFTTSLIGCACYYGHLPVVKYLVEDCKCDPSRAQGNKQVTPVQSAVIGDHLEILKYLIQLGVSAQNETFLVYWAAQRASVEMVRYLIDELRCDFECKLSHNTPLYIAATAGNLKIVQLLIKEYHCDVKIKGRRGRSVLHQACYGGYADLVSTLIREHGADIMARDDRNDTPLHVAACCGKKEVALLLINDFHCDVKMKGQVGRSVLHLACIGGNADLVDTLIREHGADITAKDDNNDTPLHMAALSGNREVALLLINVFNSDIQMKGWVGKSILHSACMGGNAYLVDTLIREYGTDITAKDDNNDTPLHVAALSGKGEVALLLINVFHCDIQMKGQVGRSTLHLACIGGNVDLVHTLIQEYGADITARDDENNTPLHVAAMHGNKEVVLLLIDDFHSDVKMKGRLGGSVLHCACYGGNADLVRTLILEHGGDITARDDQRNTPLHVAAMSGKKEVALLLIDDFRCDVKMKGRLGGSVLHCACHGGNADLVRTLILEHEGDITARDDQNNTPLHVAAISGYREVALLLINDFNSDAKIKGEVGRSVLHFACACGSADLVRTLILEHGADITARDDQNNTPLHVAALFGRKEVALLLINDFHTDITMKGREGWSVLHSACSGGNVDLVRTLILEHGADPTARDDKTDTPLHVAAFCSKKVASLLLNDFHCDVKLKGQLGRSVLHLACEGGNTDLVRSLILEHGADITARDDENDTPLHVAALCGKKVALFLINDFHCDVKMKGRLGRSVLHAACEGGNADLVRTLILEHGADITARDDLNDTPLHLAALTGQKQIALLLIQSNVKMKSIIGESVLHYACYGGNVDLVRTLILEHGADITARDDQNSTPLHAAALSGRREVALLLIREFHCDVKVKGPVGRSVLHCACYGGNVDLVCTLILGHGADITARDDEDNTPLHVAAMHGKREVALLLINDFQSDITVKGQDGRSILHSACMSGNADLVRTLILEHGADITARDDCNRTPLNVAAMTGNLEVFLLLKNFIVMSLLRTL